MSPIAAQFGIGDHPRGGTLLGPLLAIALCGLIGAALIWVFGRFVPWADRAARGPRRERRRLRAAADAELRARAQMDELCPGGWCAQFTLFARAQDLPPDAPDPSARVLLEWIPGPDGNFPGAVVRQVWATSIRGALEAMVADRLTDATLAQIELEALAEGVEWPD